MKKFRKRIPCSEKASCGLGEYGGLLRRLSFSPKSSSSSIHHFHQVHDSLSKVTDCGISHTDGIKILLTFFIEIRVERIEIEAMI
jgi:hypothetical protein